MRLSEQRIGELQALLQTLYGITLTNEEAQVAGLAILRFIAVKELRRGELLNAIAKNEVGV